jgi:hypothetical protein
VNSTAGRKTSKLVPLLVIGIIVGYIAGIGLVIAGGAQKSKLNNQYKVQFLREGDTCTKSLPAHFDIKTGRAMDCTSLDYSFVASAEFPGFSDAESAKITALAASLAGGELTKDEQGQIQTEVDKVAATKPEKAHYSGLWGSNLQFVGIGLFVLGIVAAVVLWLTFRRRKTVAPAA